MTFRRLISRMMLLFLVALGLLDGWAGATPAVHQTPPLQPSLPGFVAGADVSYLACEQQLGAVYKDGGRPRDPLAIFRSRGWNLLRLRVWVDPTDKGAEINDLPYTIALGRRIKQAGFRLLLDFHYSDTWADPAHQTKPAAWKDLPFDALLRRVETYSRDTVAAMRVGGAMPDMVQVGN